MSTIPTTVYIEMTPNPNAMKFVANRIIVKDGEGVEYKSAAETKGKSTLGEMLFNFPFVKSLYFNGNFVSITQTGGIDWNDVNLEIKEFILDYLLKNELAVEVIEKVEEKKVVAEKPSTPEEERKQAIQSEYDEQITAILDEYIRPAVEGDGGAIEFKSYDKGLVTVVLKGACSGCPSSTATLKHGIENLLKRMMPEVKEVVAEEG